ncbi:hypothetical protein [Levilactobacillus enshiensis]|uniref:hypothetical protein n=1 Tax=Levilactobacillus enshiensis TaxID=2590213 RepID=UPI00117B8DD7|nr:hypothetical protein [Levilactobacillus enshiensis]
MSNLVQRQKQIAFYELQQGKHKFDLKSKIDHIFQLFVKKSYDDIDELTIEDVRYYISAIQKIPMNKLINYGEDTVDYYCFAINIAKVDSAQQIKYGDLSKVVSDREEVVDLSDDDVDMNQVGPLVDSQFIVDPFYSVVAAGRTSGGVNLWALKKFSQQIFDTQGLRLAFIPDKKGIKDLDDMTIITAVDYKVSKTEDANDQKDDARSEMGDIALANELEADEFEVRMKSVSLNKEKTKSRIKRFVDSKLGVDEFDDVKSIKVEGIKNGQEVLFDLITNKLNYRGYIEFDAAVGMTIRDNFNYLAKAFASEVEFIQKTIALKVYEDDDKGTDS